MLPLIAFAGPGCFRIPYGGRVDSKVNAVLEMVMTRHSLGVASLRSVLGEDRLEPFHFLFQFREQVANADAIIEASFDLELQRDFRSAFRVQTDEISPEAMSAGFQAPGVL